MIAVDVLAVMDRADAHYAGWDISAADKAVLDDLNDARAAVAELLAADEEYDAAKCALFQPAEYSREKADRLCAAHTRRAAALARCKGEQA